MKILCFIDSLGPGGAQRQIVGLAKMLDQHHHEVLIITYANLNFYVNELKLSNVRFKNINEANNKFLRIFYIANEINKFKPDWVISYLDTPCIISCIIKIFSGKFKLLVSERNTTQRITLKEKIKFQLYDLADMIVPNSYAQESFISTKYPRLTKKVKTISNFVDLNYFKNNCLSQKKG